MIYGNRTYAFENHPVAESVIATESKVDVADILTNDAILEFALKDSKFAEALDSYCESVEVTEVLEEGANQDYTKLAKKYLKEYKDTFGKAFSLQRQRQFEDASKEFHKAEDIANKFLDSLEKVKTDDLKSMLIGDLIVIPVFMLEILVAKIVPALKIYASLKWLIEAAILIDEAHTLIHGIKELIKMIKGEEKFTKWGNAYKQLLGKSGKFLRDVAKKSYKACDKKYE